MPNTITISATARSQAVEAAFTEINEFLETLGSTANQVFRRLKEEGVKGTPMSPCGCPMANLLTAKQWATPRLEFLSMGDAAASFRLTWVDSVGREIDSAVVGVDLPFAVRCFIFAFDGGSRFQELVA